MIYSIKKRKAFTLIEILLAIGILGIGLVGILSVFVVGTNAVRRAVENTEASFVAQIILEDFKRQGYVDLSALTNANIPALPVPYDSGNFNYGANIVVTSPPANIGTVNGISQVDLYVNKSGRQIAEFTTYISNYYP